MKEEPTASHTDRTDRQATSLLFLQLSKTAPHQQEASLAACATAATVCLRCVTGASRAHHALQARRIHEGVASLTPASFQPVMYATVAAG
jgi:hypothetical protein